MLLRERYALSIQRNKDTIPVQPSSPSLYGNLALTLTLCLDLFRRQIRLGRVKARVRSVSDRARFRGPRKQRGVSNQPGNMREASMFKTEVHFPLTTTIY